MDPEVSMTRATELLARAPALPSGTSIQTPSKVSRWLRRTKSLVGAAPIQGPAARGPSGAGVVVFVATASWLGDSGAFVSVFVGSLGVRGAGAIVGPEAHPARRAADKTEVRRRCMGAPR